MNRQFLQKLLYYALLLITVVSLLYLLSAFGLFAAYPHFFGKAHLHRWHTLFRMCFVLVFAVVNHWIFVPRLYIKRRYLFFFSVILLCLVSLLVLPDMLLMPPKLDIPELKRQNLIAGEHALMPNRVLLLELAHMYLLFFISTFVSIAMRTRQYIQQIEQRQAASFTNNNQEISQIELAKIKYIESKKEAIPDHKIETALTVTVNYGLIRIEFAEILFLKSMDNYVQFHLKDKKPILVRMTLKEASEKLPSELFLRIHKSYIVAIAAIESMRNKTILIAKNEIPVGRSYEEAITTIFKK
jgi:DNA-binding LytR/AlgR family response regulator